MAGQQGGVAPQGPAEPKKAENQKGKILYWRSPMDPTEIYDKPGKDKMGMDLVPVYAGQEAAGPPGTVTIDPVTIQNIGVKTTTVRRKRLTREIRTVGRVAYNEEKVRQISPKIRRVGRKTVCQLPRAGCRKGRTSPRDLQPGPGLHAGRIPRRPQSEKGLVEKPLPRDRVQRQLAGRVRRAQAQPLGHNAKSQIKALRERGVITRTMVLHAPFKGIILKKDVLEGGYVQPGQNLYGIADISTVWVYADVYEYEAPWVRLGQEAVMTLATNPGSPIAGKVTYIYPYLKNMTRTLQVRMAFPNTTGFILKPDMWANVTLQSDVAREGLAVPIEAVIRTGTRDVALIALEGGRFAPRELRLGPQVDDEFEVLDGLKEGDRVVTSAQFLINSESNLQAAISKMMEAKTARPKQRRSAGLPTRNRPCPGCRGCDEPRTRSPSHTRSAEAMLEKIIQGSVRNQFLVILFTVAAIAAGVYAFTKIPVDALPDVSDVQVIIFTEWPGQPPQIVEDQVTYPLTTTMLGVAKAKVVRGYSFFGLSFVYVIFEDGTDIYWARSRVLEYLSFVQNQLPAGRHARARSRRDPRGLGL